MKTSGSRKPLLMSFLIIFCGITPQAKSADKTDSKTIIQKKPKAIFNRIIFVNNKAKGLNNGASWHNAYTSLQSALSTAAKGDNIWVAKGIYKPGTDINNSFQLKSGVNIFGGFLGWENYQSQRNFKTNITILSGDLNSSNSANKGDSYIVVKGANNCILDGVTIKYAYNTNTIGGGIYNLNASPTLKNVIITDNYAVNGGGGIYNVTSSPILTNVTISNNSTANGGGGIYNDSYSSPTLVNVTLYKNSAFYGGGMYNITSSAPNLINVVFANNSANNGGGIISDHASPILTNVTFSNNSANTNGSAMFNTNSSPVIKNTIFWGKAKRMIYQDGGILKIGYSDLQNGIANISGGGEIQNLNGEQLDSGNFITSGNNISADPLFVNPKNPSGRDKRFMTSDDGLRLQSKSHAINKGINIKDVVTDIKGTTRPKGSSTDIGAYEFAE